MRPFYAARRRFLTSLAALPVASALVDAPFDAVSSDFSASAAERKRNPMYAAEPSRAPGELNPILPGHCADPEVLFSRKTGRVYLYPTTNDGGFRVFSSDNLVDWRDDGIVLDGETVSWAKTNFWAPSIIEKKIGDRFVYYFYFCAEETIGVAVGSDPTGPFVDSGKVLIDGSLRPANRGGVEIDPFVFCDPVSGKNYLYWGNSYLCVAELNDDMTSIKRETVRDLTPPNFFEGTYVFYRDGRYRLTWSKNDTRSVDYQVWVATSDSPLGPFVSPEENAVILSKRPEKEIFGPGHHSFLFLPDGQNFIFYHRLCLPIGKSPWARETCVDRFEFAPDGSIRTIEPTREGLGGPVDLSAASNANR